MEAAFRQYVRQTPALYTLVGERIFPLQTPQTADASSGPRIVYQDISSVPLISMEKFGGHRTTRLQIRAVAADYAIAKKLARLLETASNNFRGAFTGSTAVVKGAIPQGMRDMPPETPSGAGSGIHSVVQDWMVHWKEG